MSKKFEEPKFEKTEFEAVAYLCGNSNESSNSNDKNYLPSYGRGHGQSWFPGHGHGDHGRYLDWH